MANENRDGDAYRSASEYSLELLSKLGVLCTKNKQVDPGHHAIASMARSAASVRTMLGDSMMATDRKEMAKRLWIPAAGELKEAMDAQSKTMAKLPRDSHVVDLVGLGLCTTDLRGQRMPEHASQRLGTSWV